MRDELIPLADAAVQLHVTWRTAYDLLLAGRLVGERRGHRWFVSRRSVHALAAELRREPAGAA